MRWCILGAGGLGSVLGGWLAAAGDDVVLVARPPHVEAIRRHGLRITAYSTTKMSAIPSHVRMAMS